MKKLLYIAAVDITKKSDGVWKKIKNQLPEFEKNFDTYFIGYSNSDIAFCNNGEEKILNNDSKKHRRFKLFDEAAKQVRQDQFSYVYIRYMHCDGPFIKLLKEISKKGCKIIIEMPTYPYKSEAKANYKLRISCFFDCIYRHYLKKYVFRIATYSADKEIFSIPCINIMNGINVDNIKIKGHTESSKLNLLAIASMQLAHGYDRLIEGLNDYYLNGGRKQIVLNLVGDGSQTRNYKQLTQKYKLENNVVFHGFKSGSDLDELYDKCDIAIECLGAHRKNLFLSSSLKSREYGAKGMPMVTSCAIDAFPSETCDYILKFAEDESPIDVEKIVLFYDDLLKKYKTAENLAKTIRADTRARCDISVVMKPIIDCFNS